MITTHGLRYLWTENGNFLGACEPEEVLDKGWFTNASSRALLVPHQNLF